jgi:hypothetical protein
LLIGVVAVDLRQDLSRSLCAEALR